MLKVDVRDEASGVIGKNVQNCTAPERLSRNSLLCLLLKTFSESACEHCTIFFLVDKVILVALYCSAGSFGRAGCFRHFLIHIQLR
jgi:hypothetical protein